MLEFNEVRFKNFLSYGQVEQVVKLNNKKCQLITGINKDKDSDDEGNKNGLGKCLEGGTLMTIDVPDELVHYFK